VGGRDGGGGDVIGWHKYLLYIMWGIQNGLLWVITT